jgi:hypothetical protein
VMVETVPLSSTITAGVAFGGTIEWLIAAVATLGVLAGALTPTAWPSKVFRARGSWTRTIPASRSTRASTLR